MIRNTVERTFTRIVGDRTIRIKTLAIKNEAIPECFIDESYSNCIYIEFYKEDFYLPYPKLVECDWSHMNGQRFEYEDSIFNSLPFHGGVTYYTEQLNIEKNKILITIGADYSHYDDGDYMREDAGYMILKSDGARLADEFALLVRKKE